MKKKLILWMVLLLGMGAVAGPAARAITVNIAVGDQPYYVHGPGYWTNGVYYVWVPGRWHWYQHPHHRIWVHGHYVVRHH
jgi:hypothetical protein